MVGRVHKMYEGVSNVYKILVQKSQGTRQLVRHMHKWENLKWNFMKVPKCIVNS
jgi:hypothetical protein